MWVAVEIQKKDGRVTLSNELVSLAFDLNKGTYSVTDVATRETVLADAAVTMVRGMGRSAGELQDPAGGCL